MTILPWASAGPCQLLSSQKKDQSWPLLTPVSVGA